MADPLTSFPNGCLPQACATTARLSGAGGALKGCFSTAHSLLSTKPVRGPWIEVNRVASEGAKGAKLPLGDVTTDRREVRP